MPYLDSDIRSKIFYSAFGAEILRSARTTNDAAIFQRNSKILINRKMKQGGKINRLFSTFNKLFSRHFDVFHKYINSSLEFVESLQNKWYDDDVALLNLIF